MLACLIFGLGLMLSGMDNPAKVLGFLDLASTLDPSLAFVMIGAIAIGTLTFFIARCRQRTFLDQPTQLPVNAAVTPRLVLGSAAFGIGWGLTGFCPGPSLVALGAGYSKAVGFVAAMLVFEILERMRRN